VTASFSGAGEPQQLPEHYVPQAFRDWGVELWDWQSQCSCLATPDSSSSDADRKIRSAFIPDHRELAETAGNLCHGHSYVKHKMLPPSNQTVSCHDHHDGDRACCAMLCCVMLLAVHDV
jgi:hypothetical protein